MRKKSPETTANIINAARTIMLEQGFKATTMEAIAARAGIAKGTLYAYFADKDTILSEIIDDLANRKSEAFAQAFVGDDPIAQRVGRALAAKLGVVADVLEGSTFANELIGEHARLAARLENTDEAIGELIVAEMTGAGIDDADEIFAIVSASCAGILAKFRAARDVRAAIVLLCDRMVR